MSAQYFRLGIVQRNKGFEVKHNFVSPIAVVMLFDFIGRTQLISTFAIAKSYTCLMPTIQRVEKSYFKRENIFGQNIKLFYYFILEQTGKISCEFSSKVVAVFFARRQFSVYKINNS